MDEQGIDRGSKGSEKSSLPFTFSAILALTKNGNRPF